MAIYEGVIHLIAPAPIEAPYRAYSVLLAALVFEGVSWLIAYREVTTRTSSRNLWDIVPASKDPAVFTILVEDSAALIGLTPAFLGVFLGQAFANPYPDGIASILIGVVLCLVAHLLIRESKRLLLGESANPQVVQGVKNIVLKDPAAHSVGSVLTMHMGPTNVLLNIELAFRPTMAASDIPSVIVRV
jgi:divalent metal cation (Fe/Co/Zn/Cd) transporter